jgi:hypothetical protein
MMYVKLPLLLAGTLAYLSWMTAQLQALPVVKTSQLSSSKSLSPLTPSGDPPSTIRPKPSKPNAPVQPVAPAVLGGSKGVMFYCGNEGYCSTINSITAHYRFLGATPVVQSTTLTNLSAYRLIFIIMPTQNFSAAQTSALQAFITNGGRLVVVGDYNGNWKGTPIANNLLARLAVPIRFRTDLLDGNCNTWFARNYGTNILTANLPATGVEYATTSTLQLGAGSAGLFSTVTGNQPFLAVYPQRRQLRGDVVVSGDAHLFWDDCSSTSKTQLWSNLLVNMDDDNDGLLNDWEVRGYDADGNGTIDVNLPAMGAKPKRKDIFIESDWMERCPGSRKPSQDAIEKVVDAFANSPVKNPDGSMGISLHVDYGQPGAFGGGGNKINCVGTLTWPGGFQTLKNANFDAKKRGRIFHYSIWANRLNTPEGERGGAAENVGDDLVLALGRARGGSTLDQAGMFMHELGHNFGLNHGGVGNPTEYKPNHLSVMNLSFTLTGLIFDSSEGRIDYARSSPPALNELALNEKIGINGGSAITRYGTFWYCQDDKQKTDNANGAINWNCKNGIDRTNVSTSINKDNFRVTLSSPGEEWLSLRLASPSRPGIPSGSKVGPQIQGQLAQQPEGEVSVEEQEPPLEELLDNARSIREYIRQLEPTKPQQVKAQRVGSHSILVTWKPPQLPQIEGQPIIGYEVFRHEEHNPDNAVVLVKATTNLSFLDNNVVRGKTYIYKVVALTKNFRRTGSSIPVQIP